MPFDASAIAPAERARLVRIGKRYGSSETLAQAELTLKALSAHQGAVALYGFRAADAAELRDARDALLAAGVTRADTRSGRKVTNSALATAMRDGKSARVAAHANLKALRRRLAASGSEATMRTVEAGLAQTRSAGADAEELAIQLLHLRTVITTPDVSAAIGSDAATLATMLETRATALRAASEQKAAPQGTPVQTESLDLIDGVIVELVRAARAAARAAARETGQEALAREFELVGLYGSATPREPGS